MLRRLHFVVLGLLVFLSVPAVLGQKIEEIAFFKESVGKWKGEGQSIVGLEKATLMVVDEWEGKLVNAGSAESPVYIFVQEGKVSLNNGGSFTYKWMYAISNGKLMASYRDSNQTQGNYLFKLGKDQKSVAVTPIGLKKEPLTFGLFSIAKIVDGKFVYDAEIRDKAGKPAVITRVECSKLVSPAKK